MKISVIIPAYNEQGYIGRTVERVLNAEDRDMIAEVLVVDGGSVDRTTQEARLAGAQVIESPIKGRAAQMNAGAALATAHVLYFVHADSLPPKGYAQRIMGSVLHGSDAGCMRMRFDRDHWALHLKSWFTRFKANGFHYGDQSLFIRRDTFNLLKGYREELTVFEDLDIIERIPEVGTFTVLDGPIITSARKYEANGMLRMQFAFYAMYPMYRMGLGQPALTAAYKRIIRQDKI